MSIELIIYDLNGSVKEVEAKTASLFEQDSKIIEHLESTDFYRYDKSKNLIESSRSFPEKLCSKTINVFDSDNRIIESSHYDNDLLTNKREFSYDSDGKLIEQKFYDKDGALISTHRPTYTKQGWRIDKTTFEPLFIDGKKIPQERISFTFSNEIRTSFSGKNVYSDKEIRDSDGKLLEAAFYNQRNNLLGKIFVIYDEDKKPVEISSYGSDTSWIPGNPSYWQKLLFPLLKRAENFLLTFYSAYKLFINRKYKQARQCFIYGVPFDETIIEYDEKGNLKAIKSYSILTAGGKTVFKFDEKGNKIEEISYSGNTKIITHHQNYEYEYDSQDNWIKKKTVYTLPVSGGRIMERVVLTTRTINYF